MSKTISLKPRLQTRYNSELVAKLKSDLDLSNVHDVPVLEKITVNCGIGKAKDDKKLLEVANNTVTKITGQAPVATVSRKSIATFKLREGSKIGVKVTLRGDHMYEFLDRMVNIVLPRLRDFHGMSAKAFDKQGNYAIGFKDQSVFPELSFEETANPHGLQVILTIKSKSPEHARALLEAFGMPFEKGRN